LQNSGSMVPINLWIETENQSISDRSRHPEGTRDQRKARLLPTNQMRTEGGGNDVRLSVAIVAYEKEIRTTYNHLCGSFPFLLWS